ncbi:MAG: site-specific integrase [Ignavibacteriales bacterium]|nr:site-specific integrase [Ignavibacteriales bacterium]
MQINYYLDTNQRTKNPERIIFCYIRGIKKGETIKLHTGERILEKHWDKEKQRAKDRGKDKYVGAPELNDFLDKYIEKIKRTYRVSFVENSDIKYEEIRELITGAFKESSNDFFKIYDSYLESKKNEVCHRTIQRLNTLRSHLLAFQTEKKFKITFDAINHHFNDLFVNYLINDKKFINNTVSKLVSNLKVFLNWATLRKFNTKTDYNQFKCKWSEPDLIALTNDELMKLLYFDLSSKPSLEKVRDVFCFGCFTGARYSDIEGFLVSDIVNDIWRLNTLKTKDSINIPLNDYALQIVKKYEGTGKLPVISNQKMNDFLKDLCKLVGIDTPIRFAKFRGAERIEETKPKYEIIGTHTARRTFVTLSLEKGMRPEIVMKITGHKSLKMLQRYIKITENVKESEMRRAWGNESKLKLAE